jgi:acyl carrier protein
MIMEAERPTPQKIAERVKKVVATNLDISESDIKDNSNFIDDLKADSLDIVELVMAFEEEFGCEISDQEAQKLKTIQNAVDYIMTHYENRPSA